MVEKLALVLGGGGNLGAVEVGFIQRMTELGIEPDLIVGTSVGALNAAYVAFHDPEGHDCFHDIWAGLRGKKLFHRSLPRIALQLWRSRMSLYDDSFVSGIIRSHLREDDFRAARIPLHITATNIVTGRREIFSKGSISQAVLASTAIPGLFPPVEIEHALYVDGGVSAGTDIAAAVELGATQIIAVDLKPGLLPRRPKNVVELLTRSLEVIAEERSTCTIEHAHHQANVVHIRPGITAQDSGGFEDVDRLLRESYSLARHVFSQCWDGRSLRPGNYGTSGAIS
jgi:NTE family protein